MLCGYVVALTNSLLSLKFISCQKGDGEQDSIAVKWAIFSPNPTHFFSVFFCSIRCDAIRYIDTMHKSACQKSQETFRDFCFWHMKFNMLLHCTLRVLGLTSIDNNLSDYAMINHNLAFVSMNYRKKQRTCYFCSNFASVV